MSATLDLPPTARITGINVYPVKSCRGIALDRARIAATGFEHDREWLIVRPDGRFITQREEPRLALIETALLETATGAYMLRLRTPLGAELSVDPATQGNEVEVTCWKDRCAAFDAGEAAAEFLTQYLGAPLRLVRFDSRRKRPSNAEWTQGVEALNQFSDGYAWLLLSEASLADLNSRLPRALPMNRFRPNIVVSSLPPYGEDRVHELVANGVRLRGVKPCTRCIVPTTDQASGKRDGDEPLRTLRQYRFNKDLKGVMFGQNMILIDGLGAQLRVGQELQVTAM
jgi:uncharacterized protein YcbX